MNFKGRFFEAFISGAWKSKSRCPEVVPCRKQVQVSLRLISLLQAVKNPFFKAPEKVRRKKKKKNPKHNKTQFQSPLLKYHCSCKAGHGVAYMAQGSK